MSRWLHNPTDNRLRAGWRILLFLILLAGLSIVGQTAVKAALGGIPKDPFLRTATAIGLAAVAATIAVPLARGLLDRRSFRSLGLVADRRAARDLAFGFVLSGAMAGVVFIVMWAAGWIEVHGVEWGAAVDATADPESWTFLPYFGLKALIALLLLDAVVGWWEELVFRGYLLQNMMEGIGLGWAVAVSCVLYGAVHAANPNAGVLSTSIIVLFGWLRIYGYLATGMLWLSIGMHVGWNFFQGAIFGYSASGHDVPGLIVHSPTGPDWLSGGSFGPEASVLTVPCVLLALVAMRAWARRTRPAGPAFVPAASVATTRPTSSPPSVDRRPTNGNT
jgi:membrane protease YdiL (CAAX protease family)